MSAEIWMVVCEIAVQPGDLRQSGATKAFARITTWASSEDALKEKISSYLESFNWRLLSIERARRIQEKDPLDDETAEMITRTRANEQAIILGRFFSYPDS
jgi:hypothetical protein